MSGQERVVVIGSGAAGRSAARSLAIAGRDVTIIENDKWGGTCLWRGCIPKKSLYETAEVMRTVRGAEQFGVSCGDPEVDWPGALAWKWHAQESYAGDQLAFIQSAGSKTLPGTATFVSENAIEVDGTRLEFDHAIIATGSVAVRPQVSGANLADTSDDALRYATLPSSLVIVGGGFIAFELAGIFGSLGTEVTVVVREERPLVMLDPELASSAARALDDLGVRIVTGTGLAGISNEDGSLLAHVSSPDGRAADIPAERILLATGRRPALDGLGLELAGVMLDSAGHLIKDECMRTSNPHIWAAGDAAGGMMQTPVASMEGHTVAASIITGEPTRPDCSVVPVTCFTVPQLATVGLTEQQAKDQGRQVSVHRIGHEEIGQNVITGSTQGFLKLVVSEPDGVILGAQSAGPGSSDVIYAAAVAIGAGMTGPRLAELVAVHPSFAESLFYAGW